MTFDEWFHKEYEPADLQIKQCAERNEGLHIPATCYLEDLKKAFEAGLHTDVHTDNSKVIAELEEKLANADYQLEGRDVTIKELEAQIEKMLHTLLDLLWFEENLDPYMYECNDAQKGELFKPFDNARLFLEKYKCKKCKGEGTIKVGYNGWAKNPCPTCKGKGYVF